MLSCPIVERGSSSNSVPKLIKCVANVMSSETLLDETKSFKRKVVRVEHSSCTIEFQGKATRDFIPRNVTTISAGYRDPPKHAI
ncbi:hypothetical protein BTUL_0015g01020 [Botrytis tulipae]|uniref:Uncharacterized protein n=1 Tax=Botrytis tulipae TaxID=87230 RepID=A0A4Z1F0A7_9HELO|nr:hypothetical protein BTUL_0015g01020 [Botrytis tulipae]